MNIFKRIILSLCILAAPATIFAQRIASVSGDWNNTATWGGAAPPTALQTATIMAGVTVTLDGGGAEQCSSLTINGTLQTGESGGLYIGAGNLTVGGFVKVSATGTLEANGGFGGTSTLTINNGGATALDITAAGGVINLVNSSSFCDVTFTGTASTIIGACTFNNLTISTPGVTVTCTNASQTISGNLTVTAGTLSCTTKTLTVANNVAVSGTLSFSSGILSQTNVADSVLVNSGATLSFSTGRLSATGDVDNAMGTISFTGAGIFGGDNVYNNGTITLVTTNMDPTGNITNFGAGTITGTVAPGTVHPGGLLLQASTGNITYTTGSVNTVGDLDVTSGSIVTTTGGITAGQNLNLSNNGTISPTSGAITVTNGNLSLSGTSSIASSSSVAANITVSNGNLSLSGTNATITLYVLGALNVVKGTSNIGAMCTVQLATGTYTSGSDLTLSGTLTFTGAGNLKIAGNYIFGGTYTVPNTATVTFNGASPQTISGPNITFYKLTISNAVSLLPGTTTFTVSNTFLISALVGTFDVGTNDFYCDGTMTNSNVTASSATAFNAESQTVIFNGTTGLINGAQQFTFNNLYINVSGGGTVTELGTHVAAPQEIVNGNLTVTTGTLATTTTTVQVKGTVTLTDTYSATTGTLQVGGDFINNGSYTPTGAATPTVLMNGTGNQNITGSTATTFYNLTVTNTGITPTNVIPGSNITVNENLTINSGQFNCDVNSITAGASTAAAKFTLLAPATFSVGNITNASSSSTFPAHFALYALAGTVIYENDGNAGQMIYNECTYSTPVVIGYGTLEIFTGTTSSSSTLSNAASALTMTGNLEIGDGINSGTATLAVVANVVTVDGNFTISNNGIFTSSTGTTNIEGDFIVNNNTGFNAGTGTATINMDGTLAQNHLQNIDGSATSLTFNNLTCHNLGSVTATSTILLGYPVTVNGLVTITTGALDANPAGNYQITCNGGWSNAVALTGFTARNGTVLFTPPSGTSTAITGTGQTSFYNLTISPATSYSVTVTGSHAAPMEVVGHELNVTAGTFVLAATTVTVGDSVTIPTGSAITATTGKLSATNDINNAGTITITGAAGNLTSTAGNIYNLNTISFTDAAGANPVLDAVNFFNTPSATLTGGITVANFTGSLYNYSIIASPGSIGFTTGTINITDSVYNAAGASITFTTGKLQATGDINNNGTITFSGLGTLKAANFYNTAGATVTGVTTLATFTGSLYNYSTTAGSIGFTTGTITLNGALPNDSVYNAAGASITFTTGGLKPTGDIDNNGTISFIGAGTLTANNFYNTITGTLTGVTTAATIHGYLYNYSTTAGSIGFSSGTITVTDSIYNAAGATIAFSAAGKLISSTEDISNYGSITYANAGTLQAINIYNNNAITFSTLGAGTITASNIFADSPGAITFNTSTATVSGTAGNGNVTIANGATLTYTTGGLKLTGNFTDNGLFTITGNTGTVTFNNVLGGTQIISGTQPASGSPAIPIIFDKLTVAGTGNTVLLADSVQTNGLLTLTTGSFDVSTSDYHLTCKAGFTNSTGIPTAFNSEAGCVWFIGAQNVTGKTIFNDAVLENGNITMASPMVFLDTLTSVTGSVSAGLLKNTSPNTVTIGNSLFNNSAVAFTPGTTGIVLFENNTNSTCQIGSITAHAITLKNLTVNLAHATDVVNMTTALTVSVVDSIQNGIFNCENFTLTGAVAAGTFLYMSSTSELTLGLETSATNSAFPLYTTYNIDPASTVIYEAATNLQKINASPTYGNLKVFIGGASGIAKTFLVAGSTLAIAGNLTVGDASTVGVATLNCTTSTVNLTGNALINNDGNITFTTAAGAFNIGGNFTNNLGLAGFTGGLGTTTFNNTTTTQTISGTAATTFYNVAIGANAYNVIISQNENAGGTFTINSGATFDCGSVALSPSVYPTMSVTGLFTNGGIFLGDVGTLALSGDLTNNSTFTAQTGTVSFNKAGTENINGSTAIAFYNATLNGSSIVNISTIAESLTHVLSLSGASCQLNGSQTLTMVSTPTFSAQLGPVTTGANISLPFVMQRYVGGTKANYEALACPSQASTLNDWANDAGFYMSGVGGPDGNAGSFQSVYTINEPTDAYVAVTTTSFPLTPGLGLYIYMATTISSFTPFTFATHGTPTYGSFTYGITHSASPGTGSNLVGNPYDCPLSWTALVATNSSNIIGSGSSAYFSVFDRTLGNWVSSNGTSVTNGASVLASNPNVIPEHQGFLVSAASTGNMTFAEADKTTVDQIVYKPYTGGVADLFNITLSDNMNAYQGGTSIEFNNNSKAMYVQGEDVLYMKSLTQEAPILYTLSSDGKFLNVNSQPLSTDDEQDVMFYGGGNITGNYTLTFKGIDKLSKFNCIQLEDLRLGKTVQIEEGSSYTYQLNNTGTYKFIIHFKKLQQGLPCIISVAANGGINQDLNAAVDIYKNQNGVTAKFTMSESQPAIISVYDMLGQKVEQDITRNVMDEEVQIPLPSTTGMYIIRIETPGGVTTKRIYQ